MMIQRQAADVLKRYAASYPVVTVTGPRQSGKTTLVKMLFPEKKYLNLENPEIRQFARQDPNGFLSGIPQGAILDEIQRVPELFSYIMTIVDENPQNGLFILTGSAQFQMLESISQSLSGRTALLYLLPFNIDEAYGKMDPGDISLDELMFRGFYPRVLSQKLDPTEAFSFYLETYLQRDVRGILNVKDLDKFERFLQICAGRTGQLVNLASMAGDLGLSHNTIQSWLSVLKASFIITFLHPYHTNINKRVLKTPKLYFLDAGLAAFLLGIDRPSELRSHPLRGALFETLVVSECLKYRFNAGKRDNLYFFRDKAGNEVDILMKYGEKLFALEVKSAETFHADFTKGLDFIQALLPGTVKGRAVVYGGKINQAFRGIDVTHIFNLPPLLAKTDPQP